MKRQNLIASVAVLVALLFLGAVSAYFLLRPGASPSPDMARAPESSESAAPDAGPRASEPTPPVSETEAKPKPATPKPAENSAAKTEEAPAESKPEEKTAEAPAARPSAPDSADQPSFDVVRIEPTGEGVIAGRAAPGWKVMVESRGVKLAEAAADDQGEWTIVLDKPLAAGAHTLSLKATSPDGRQEFSSKQTVSADVAVPRAVSTAAGPVVTSGAQPGDVAPAPTVQPPADAVAMAPKPGVLPAGTAQPPAATGVSAPRAAKPPVVSPRQAMTPSGAAPLSQTAAVEEERAASPSSLSPQTKPGTYTILPGDTLWDIAQRYLGAGWRYKTIFRDNRKIIRNPNLIYPEQTMTIPEPSSEPN
ncbi:MAG: LysM peptidoglycan-binding domain-containing protein [Methyloceanibacter sp.]|uniref:LysM peptidoglycan-binding domain-containing protein n=1 Tax=Methyloceanibacter sp. TaxID=1965321 RepID=UPI003D9BB55C